MERWEGTERKRPRQVKEERERGRERERGEGEGGRDEKAWVKPSRTPLT